MDAFTVTPELVRNVGKLAALDLDAADEQNFVDELNRILGYMRQLDALVVSDIEATFQTVPIVNIMRNDQLTESLTPSEVLQNAPQKEEGFFKMPPILE